MRRVREVLRLRHALGMSDRSIAQSLGIGKTTVGEYVCRAKVIGITWPVPEEIDDAELERRLFRAPSFEEKPKRPPLDWPRLHEELKRRGVTLMLLWLEYRANEPDGFGYSRFCGLYGDWRRSVSATMRQTHAAGEKLFVARQAGDIQHGPGLAIHGRRVHQRADQERHRDQHGRQRRVARQCLRRAAVAQRQIRGGVSQGLRQRVRGPHIDWPLSRLLQPVADPTRALTSARPIKPTSPRCPSAWQPNHGRCSTYRRGDSVQTTGTSSVAARRDFGRFRARRSERIYFFTHLRISSLMSLPDAT
jgi:hypothetical protein